MDETIPVIEDNENERQPVEIKFGDVVQFTYQPGSEPSKPMVVVNPEDEGFLVCAGIVSDDDKVPKLGGPGGHIHPAEVIGNWPAEKVERGWTNMFGDHAHYLIDDLLPNSQKPPIIYKGKFHQDDQP